MPSGPFLVPFRIVPGLLLGAALVLAMAISLPLSAQAQQQQGTRQAESAPLAPEARQAVISGRITGIFASGMTIDSDNREITVDAGTLTRSDAGADALAHYFEKGMFVRVEGILTGRDEVDASRITRISRYEPGPQSGTVRAPPVTPYIADDPGIIGADELEPLGPLAPRSGNRYP